MEIKYNDGLKLHDIFPDGRWYIDHDGVMFIWAGWDYNEYTHKEEIKKTILVDGAERKKEWMGFLIGWVYLEEPKKIEKQVTDKIINRQVRYCDDEGYISEKDLVYYFECEKGAKHD